MTLAGKDADMLLMLALPVRRLLRSALLLGTIVFMGCGEPNPLGRRPVHGRITFQGQPVDYGAIQLIPDDLQHGVNSGAMIEAGRYSIKLSQGLPPGSYQVLITSPDRSQMTKVEEIPGDLRTYAAERIPKKYNLKSELKIDVQKARGALEQNFDLN